IGKTWFNTGDLEMAQQHYSYAGQLLQAAGVTTGPAIATLLLEQSYVLWRKSDCEEACRTSYQALNMFREALRHHDQANAAIPYATAIRRTLAGDPVDCGRAHTLLAAIAVTECKHADALDHW